MTPSSGASRTDRWVDILRDEADPEPTLRSLLRSACPLEHHLLAERQAPPSPRQLLQDRLRDRSYVCLLKRAQKWMKAAQPTQFVPDDGVLGNYQTGCLGLLRGQPVLLLTLPAGQKTWTPSISDKREIATVAALFNSQVAHVLLVGEASQFNLLGETVQIDPVTRVAEAVLEDPRLLPGCGSCSICRDAGVGALGTSWGSAPVMRPYQSKGFVKAPLPDLPKLLLSGMMKHVEETDKRPAGYHPSTIGTEVEEQVPCIRVPYYDNAKAPRSAIQPHLMLTFQMGHCWHDVIQDLAVRAEQGAVQDEVKVRVGRLCGSADLWDANATHVMDLKTKSKAGNSHIRGYYGQVHCYAWALEPRPTTGSLIAIYKDSATMHEEVFPIDPKMLQRVGKITAAADEAVDGGYVPPRFKGASRDHPRCKDCYFYTHCWSTP